MYSIGTDADLSLGLNDGDEMDEDGNEGRQVEVVMPEGVSLERAMRGVERMKEFM